MGGHHLCLTTNGDQYTPVAEDEDGKYNDVERQEVPEQHCLSQILTIIVPIAIAYAIYHSGRSEHQWYPDYDSREPTKRYCRVNHPRAQLLLSPDVMDHLEIALNGDGGDVESGAVHSIRNERIAIQRNAQPVAQCASVAEIAKLHRIGEDHKKAGEEIKSILVDNDDVVLLIDSGWNGGNYACIPVDNQRVLLVLFRCDQCIQDESVACRSHHSHDYYSATEIELGVA